MKITTTHKVVLLSLLALVFLLMATLTWTSFQAQSQVSSNSFSTGRPDLYLLKNPGEGINPDNLSHTIPGLHFTNIRPNWTDSMGLKLYNEGTVNLQLALKNTLLSSSVNPELAEVISVRVTQWHDGNQDGGISSGESGAILSDWKTLAQWSQQPVDLGTIQVEEVFPIILSFKVGDLNNSYSGKSISYDFMFDANGAN